MRGHVLTSAGGSYRYIRTAGAIDRFRGLSAQIRRVGRVVPGARTSDSTWPVKRLRERTGRADLRCGRDGDGRLIENACVESTRVAYEG